MITFRVSFLIIFIYFQIAAQEFLKPIQLHPDIGDTLDFFERNYFEIYPSIGDFQFATFYQSSSTSYIMKIYLDQNGEKNSKTISLNHSQMKSLTNIVESNKKKYNPSYYANLITRKGNKYELELHMFDTNYVYFLSETNPSNSDSNNFFKIPVNEIDTIYTVENPGMHPAFKGAIFGGVIGAILGIVGKPSTSFNTGYMALSGGLFFAAVGLAIGIIYDAIDTSADYEDKLIKPTKTELINSFKTFLMYNFGNDKELINKYKLIE
jgi:hypothetical protein